MKFNLQELLAQYNSKKVEDDFPEDKARFTDDKRTEARLLAIQAIFMSENTDKTNIALINESIEYFGLKSAYLDKKLFVKIAEHALNNKDSIIEEIKLNLDESWSLERIDPVAKAILIMAVAELQLKQASAQVIVSEYLALSSAFLDEKQIKFINGVLASVIKKYNFAK